MSDEAKTLDRFAKLLALTSSSHIEEARTAAYMACRLLIKHRLHVSMLPVQPRSEPAQPRQEYQKQQQEEQYREIIVKYSSLCKKCRCKIAVDDDAWWRPKSGMFCVRCGPPS
jgi:hypothetical protein